MVIEEFVINYLNSKLEVKSFAEVPSGPPESFIVVEKTGSSKRNYVITSNIAIKSHAPTMYDAAMLNEDVKAVMEHIINEKEISYAECETDYNFTDLSTKRYRYQAVYNLVHF